MHILLRCKLIISLAFTKQQFFLRVLQTILSIVMIIIASRVSLLAVAIAYLLAYCFVVIIKMGFISHKIDYGLKKSLLLIVKSYQIALVYVFIHSLTAEGTGEGCLRSFTQHGAGG